MISILGMIVVVAMTGETIIFNNKKLFNTHEACQKWAITYTGNMVKRAHEMQQPIKEIRYRCWRTDNSVKVYDGKGV